MKKKGHLSYLLVECDKCGAPVGEKCYGNRKSDHQARNLAAHYFTRGFNAGLAQARLALYVEDAIHELWLGVPR